MKKVIRFDRRITAKNALGELLKTILRWLAGEIAMYCVDITTTLTVILAVCGLMS